jgi:ABC-2 type transport system permease protein
MTRGSIFEIGPTLQQWRVARLGPVSEVHAPGRIAAMMIRSALAVFLAVVLWRALYAGTTDESGLTREQAVTFMVLASLLTGTRMSNRWLGGDTVVQRMQSGTILYWFLRPISPRRYYFVRGMGELAYGHLWLVAGFVICLAARVITPPAPGMAPAALASLVLSDAIFYQVNLLLDLLCFWTVVNQSAMQIMFFIQTLLAGGFAPLWFFPDWFITASGFLPFQGMLNTPISLYIGRISASAAAGELAVQAGWMLALWLLSRWLWEHAARRVTVQGG